MTLNEWLGKVKDNSAKAYDLLEEVVMAVGPDTDEITEEEKQIRSTWQFEELCSLKMKLEELAAGTEEEIEGLIDPEPE